MNNQKLPNNFLVMRDRPSALTPTCWNQIIETSDKVKNVYGTSLSSGYMIFNEGRMVFVLDNDDWDDVAESVSEKIINNKDYFNSIKEKTEEAKVEVLSFLQKNDSKKYETLELKDLYNSAKQINDLFDLYDSASILSWFVAGDKIKQKISDALDLSEEDLDIVSMPDERTFASQLEKDVLEVGLSDKDIKSEAIRLSKKYYWIPFNYDGPTSWDPSYFVDQINEVRNNIDGSKEQLEGIILNEDKAKNKKIEILGSIESVEQKKMIDVLTHITLWTDERKMIGFQLFYHYSEVLSAISDVVDIPVLNLKYLFTHELQSLQSDKDSLISKIDFRMNNEFVTLANDKGIRILSPKEKDIFKKAIEEKDDHGKEIKGNVASKGPEETYKAKVNILNSSHECSKVEDGEFLVATMTTPDYVPAMKKAIGFITDEGGITCHAAIIAREMNKPCVIGTKNATKVLKDGDVVEVNVKSGTVKVIK